MTNPGSPKEAAMGRCANESRTTAETRIQIALDLDCFTTPSIETGVGFFDHMLTLMAAHGRLALSVTATGDLEIDAHHTIEDVGLVLGDAIGIALGDRAGVCRYGHAVVPMDESLAEVTVDLSNRPFLVFDVPDVIQTGMAMDVSLAKEFFRALVNRAGLTLHVRVPYGENGHHVLEAVFKAAGRALRDAVAIDPQSSGIPSTKGTL